MTDDKNITPPATDSYQERPLRSYVLRTGRMTEGQKRAFEEHWAVYGIDYNAAPLDLDQVFGRDAHKTLEIGFGNGVSLAAFAEKCPGRDFIGIEVHTPGVGRCMLEAAENGSSNLRVICHDAIEVLREQIPNESLDAINLFFPDPWHKKRHHKRRIVQHDFVMTLSNKLKPGGYFHVATDWPDYAEHIREVMEEQQVLKTRDTETPWRPYTRFEDRGVNLGHPIWEQAFYKD